VGGLGGCPGRRRRGRKNGPTGRGTASDNPFLLIQFQEEKKLQFLPTAQKFLATALQRQNEYGYIFAMC
jgi:hypothetical protein